MKRILIALLAGTALTLPAAAAEQAPANSGNNATHATQSQSSINLTKPQIQLMQRVLKNNGFDVGTADGVMGPKTEAALKQYQQQKGLNASGHPDPATLSALLANMPAGGAAEGRTYARNRPAQGQPQGQQQNQSEPAQQNQQQNQPQEQQPQK